MLITFSAELVETGLYFMGGSGGGEKNVFMFYFRCPPAVSARCDLCNFAEAVNQG